MTHRAVYILLMVFFIVSGRIQSLHMTEGEALIQYWRYWAAALFFGAMYLVSSKRGG